MGDRAQDLLAVFEERSLIRDDMMLEGTPVLLPARAIQRPGIIQTFAHRVRHGQRMMRVVVREQALTTEREDSVQAVQPSIDAVEMLPILSRIERLGLWQTARRHLEHFLVHRNAANLEGFGHQPA